jgi:hypothetical protein
MVFESSKVIVNFSVVLGVSLSVVLSDDDADAGWDNAGEGLGDGRFSR